MQSRLSYQSWLKPVCRNFHLNELTNTYTFFTSLYTPLPDSVTSANTDKTELHLQLYLKYTPKHTYSWTLS